MVLGSIISSIRGSIHLGGIHVDGGAVAWHAPAAAPIASKRHAPALPPGHTPLPWKQAVSVSGSVERMEKEDGGDPQRRRYWCVISCKFALSPLLPYIDALLKHVCDFRQVWLATTLHDVALDVGRQFRAWQRCKQCTAVC